MLESEKMRVFKQKKKTLKGLSWGPQKTYWIFGEKEEQWRVWPIFYKKSEQA